MGQPDDQKIYGDDEVRCAKMAKVEESLISMNKFKFKEVLGGDSSRKNIFILLENTENESDKAILIMDKLSFSEDGDIINSWLSTIKLDLKAENDIYYNYISYLNEEFNGIKTTIIYPCTEKHVIKYRRKEPHIIYETYDDYKNISLSYIESQSHSLQWVYNVIEGKSEADRVIHRDEDDNNGFLIAMDLKWSGIEVDSLYLQAIIKRRDIPCIRALKQEHLPLLRSIRDTVYKVVNEKYNLKKSQIKMYFHYHPSYYHLHLHIINLKYEAPASGMTSIPLEEVIYNIENYPDYYQKATLMFIKGEGDPLLNKFIEAGRIEI